jgi:hypothetical protein
VVVVVVDAAPDDDAVDADEPAPDGLDESEHAATAQPAVAVAPMRKLRRDMATVQVYYRKTGGHGDPRAHRLAPARR